MRQALGRRLPWLGDAASPSAIAAPPPGRGEVRRTSLPDNFDGIRFEIGRMIEYVRRAGEDAFFLAHVGRVCRDARLGRSDRDPTVARLEAIDAWCRRHYVYVNDPTNIEVIQTPQRMVRQTMVPPEVLRRILDPIYAAMAAGLRRGDVEDYEPPPLCFGDCDEGASLILANSRAARVGSPAPDGGSSYRFRFGGHDGTLHHVWSWVHCAGEWRDADVTEPEYSLGEHSRFPLYEDVEVPADGRPVPMPRVGSTALGRARLGDEAADARATLPSGFRRLAERIAAGRRDAVLIDAARIFGVHYARMAEKFSALEGTPVPAHNNKTLFVEGIDIMCRALFSPRPSGREGSTEDPSEPVAELLRPWYESLELEDPSTYRLRPTAPPPAYAGDPLDAQCAMLAMCAALDIGPIRLAAGMRDGAPERVWGRVQADGRWWDVDSTDPELVLGDQPDYDEFEEIEVPL